MVTGPGAAEVTLTGLERVAPVQYTAAPVANETVPALPEPPGAIWIWLPDTLVIVKVKTGSVGEGVVLVVLHVRPVQVTPFTAIKSPTASVRTCWPATSGVPAPMVRTRRRLPPLPVELAAVTG